VSKSFESAAPSRLSRSVFSASEMGLDSHCDLNVSMPEIPGDFRNWPLEQDEMDAWRVSLAVDGDVLLDIGLAALDHNGRFPDYGARQSARYECSHQRSAQT